jgi:hypothetical protein
MRINSIRFINFKKANFFFQSFDNDSPKLNTQQIQITILDMQIKPAVLVKQHF